MREHGPGALARVAGLVLAWASGAEARAGEGGREPIPATRATPVFHNTCTSEHFEFAADDGTPLEPLAWIAEEARRKTRAWLGSGEEARGARRVHVYFTDDLETLYFLESRHGVPASRAFHATHAFTGRCYPVAGLIVVPYRQVESRRWQLVHEIVHTVFQEVVGRNVEIVNEGLAELLPHWILRVPLESPEGLDAEYELYDRRAARAVLAREVPTLSAFVALDSDEFYAARSEWLGYALAWKLVKVLVEHDHASIQGRFPRLLQRLGQGEPLWPALASTYDVSLVEAAWLAEIERAAPWQPLFGDWKLSDEGLVGSTAPGHSACAITRDVQPPSSAFSLAYTLPAPPPSGLAVGFALEVQSPEDFIYVEIRPGGRQVAIARRQRGAWTEVTDYVLPEAPSVADPADPRGHVLELSARPGGVLFLAIDRIVVLRHVLDRDLSGGRVGVMLESREGDGVAAREFGVRFTDIRLAR